MKTVEVKASQGTSYIHVGESLKNVGKYLPKEKKCVIITDVKVQKYYGREFPKDSSMMEIPVITISTGEEIKTVATVEMIFRKLIALGADRSTFILGIGGGIVCDITGFAASIYMRGVEFGFVSTTLLSQVDASVGGKNGVNFDSYKNMVGVFCQPKFVICDTSLLKTLPSEEISNGFAEIVKHALIADASMLDYIESNIKRALDLDSAVIERLVEDSVKLKASVVQRDEKEAGERKKLNFGHTLAHALEKLKPIGHGKAVSIGMVAASSFSVKKGLLTEKEFQRVKKVLESLNLPVTFDNFDAAIDQILNAMTKDKKKDNDKISFVFLNKIGDCTVLKISFEELRELFINS